MNAEQQSVSVVYAGPAFYSELAPLLDELTSHGWVVSTRVSNPESTGYGGGFGVPVNIVFEGVKFAGEAIAAGIIGNLASDGFKGLRESILQFVKVHRAKSVNKSGPLFAFRFGDLWLVYRSDILDQELVRSLLAAIALVDAFKRADGERYIGHFEWESASGTWTGPYWI